MLLFNFGLWAAGCVVCREGVIVGMFPVFWDVLCGGGLCWIIFDFLCWIFFVSLFCGYVLVFSCV